MERDGEAIPKATSTLSTMPDLPVSLPTLADIARRRELKSYFHFRILGQHFELWMSSDVSSVGSTISMSDVV